MCVYLYYLCCGYRIWFIQINAVNLNLFGRQKKSPSKADFEVNVTQPVATLKSVKALIEIKIKLFGITETWPCVCACRIDSTKRPPPKTKQNTMTRWYQLPEQDRFSIWTFFCRRELHNVFLLFRSVEVLILVTIITLFFTVSYPQSYMLVTSAHLLWERKRQQGGNHLQEKHVLIAYLAILSFPSTVKWSCLHDWRSLLV